MTVALHRAAFTTPVATWKTAPIAAGNASLAIAKGNCEMEPIKGYAVDELMRRAIRNARARDGKEVPRWAAVRDSFSVGSTTATAICQAYEFDPNETVPGFTCPNCIENCDEPSG